MTERESYVHEWIEQVSIKHKELGGFAICPYASGSDTLVKDTPIDDIVPEPGYDVILFIVEDFWKPAKIVNGFKCIMRNIHSIGLWKI